MSTVLAILSIDSKLCTILRNDGVRDVKTLYKKERGRQS